MRVIIEKLLEDVDEDIRTTMLSEAEPEGMAEAYMKVVSTTGSQHDGIKNWQLVQDPLFFIIQWQELRNENKSRK